MDILTLTVILMAAGAGVFLLLGAAHMVVTLQSGPEGGPMTPVDAEVRAAMVRTGGLGLAPDLQTSLWRAWVGFNLSHALGVVAVAGIVLSEVLTGVEAALDRPWFVVAVLVLPAVYLILSVRYWFRDPTVGIALGGLLLWSGALLGVTL